MAHSDSSSPASAAATPTGAADSSVPEGLRGPIPRPWEAVYPDYIHTNLDYDGKTLSSVYEENLRQHADKPATWFFGAKLTFAELDRKVRSIACGLRALGIGPGDHVAMLLPNCPQHVIAYQAVLALGATVVEHNPLYTAHELEAPFNDHQARVAIVWDKAAPLAEELRRRTPLETIISVNMIEAMPRAKQLMLRIPLPPITAARSKLTGPAENTIPWRLLESEALGGRPEDFERFADTQPDDVAFILYTSGTTGAPKGAQLTHRNVLSMCMQGCEFVPNLGDEPERFLAVLPLFHAYGLAATAVLPFFVGGQIILLPAPSIDLIMQVFKKVIPTFVVAVPLLYQRIIEEAQKRNIDITGVRAAIAGAATLPPEIVAGWEELTGGLLVEGYGLTETSPVVAGNPFNEQRRPGYIGVPFPDVDAIIGDQETGEPLPYGEAGELLIRAPQVFKGYLNNEEATRNSFHGEFYRTGDIAVMDETGFIRLVGRLKEIIITGGFNVYPAEVEDVLLQHPDVEGATVVGLPRGDGSEEVVAAVKLRKGAPMDPEGLKEHGRKLLARYKVPRKFFALDELPSDAMGKTRRLEVRELLLNQ